MHFLQVYIFYIQVIWHVTSIITFIIKWISHLFDLKDYGLKKAKMSNNNIVKLGYIIFLYKSYVDIRFFLKVSIDTNIELCLIQPYKYV